MHTPIISSKFQHTEDLMGDKIERGNTRVYIKKGDKAKIQIHQIPKRLK